VIAVSATQLGWQCSGPRKDTKNTLRSSAPTQSQSA